MSLFQKVFELHDISHEKEPGSARNVLKLSEREKREDTVIQKLMKNTLKKMEIQMKIWNWVFGSNISNEMKFLTMDWSKAKFLKAKVWKAQL